MIGKKIVLHIKKNYNYFHQKKTTCTFLYIQKEKIANCFNIQKGRPFAKSKTIIVTFLYTKKQDTLLYAISHGKFEFGIYIQYDTLSYVIFLYTTSKMVLKN